MNPHQLTFRLSRLDAEECPRGVPADVWALFVCEADKVRLSGRTHYSARTIIASTCVITPSLKIRAASS
jgi:hypothetical protein